MVAGIRPTHDALTPKSAEKRIGSMEAVLGPLPVETKKMIMDRAAENVDTAQNEAERRNDKYSRRLIENLGLKEGEEYRVEAAREAIRADDPTGEKIKIFEQALEYYENEQPAAEVPVYHSTGSYALAKIIEHGALESKRNVATGEHASTGEARGTTSLAIGGYPSSEVVSRAYARMNERRSRLKLDQNDVAGTTAAEDIVQAVFKEISGLKPEEQRQVRSYIEYHKRNQGRGNETDEEFMRFKMKDVGERKYYFDLDHAQGQVDDIKRKMAEARMQGREWKVQELNGRLAQAEERIRAFEAENDEMKREMTDPFPVVLVYEGKTLPAEDLQTPIGGLVVERRTGQPLGNNELRQIKVPLESIEKAKAWLRKRSESLPADSPERQALDKVRIVPMEFIEAKRIINS